MRTLLVLCAFLATAPPARAAVPAPTNCSVPSVVRIVGWNGVAPDDALGSFTITVRDAVGAPVAGSLVLVDVAAIADVRLSAQQLDPQAVLSCPHRCVRKTTGADGTVRFTLVGRGAGPMGTPGPLLSNVYADGVLIGRPRVVVFDLDGTGGIGANDVSLWLADYGSGLCPGRSDYNGDGVLSANDLSLWRWALGEGGSSVSPTLVCP